MEIGGLVMWKERNEMTRKRNKASGTEIWE